MHNTLSVPSAARPVLSRSTLMTVRRLLHAYREGWLLERRFAEAARMIAEDARLQDLAPEAMLIATKQAWAALDDVWRLSPLDARELLSRLVTLSVRDYYEPSRASRRAERQAGPAWQVHAPSDA